MSRETSAIDFRDVPVWLWLGLPLAILIVPYGIRGLSLDWSDRWVYGELGLIENLTVILLLLGIASGIKAYRNAASLPAAWLKYWILLIVIGCIYYAGEEISWGQHYFGWVTPEYWQQVNDQQEFNLHNTSGLLDQVPRTLLSVAAVVGGVLTPLFMRRRWNSTGYQYWFWPTLACLPSALLANLIHLPDKLPKSVQATLPTFFDIREGESKECFLAAFLMLYLLSLALRASRAHEAERS